jgi:hypothetical protein
MLRNDTVGTCRQFNAVEQLRRARFLLLAVAATLFTCLGIARSASAQTQVAVEYYYAAWDYYFATSFPDEIAILDGGAFGGVWKRTGQTFNVWSQPISGASATCRFFSTSFAPKSSHFYTPFASECATVKNNPNWQYEAIAFYLQLPGVAGTCAAGTTVLYRLYNNGMGGAPNHRYTTNASIAGQMRAAGWVLEGNGVTGAFACVPGPTSTTAAAEGFWSGSLAWQGSADAEAPEAFIYGIILDTGAHYFIYTFPGTTAIAGVVQGNGTSVNNRFASLYAREIFIGYGVNSATITGGYRAKFLLDTTLASGSAPDTQYGTIFALYDASYLQPANLAAAAGIFTGLMGSAAGWQPTTITLSPTGILAGASSGCSFTGTAVPRGIVNVFDLTITFNGGSCVFGTAMLTGIARYDASSRQLYASAPNAAQTEGFLFSGGK